MDTKSSEESSIEKEPMETSTGVDQEDSGEEEVDGDEEEEEGSDFYWEKDSFDGREYHPSDDSEYSDEDLQERARYYNRTVIETKVVILSSFLLWFFF